MTSLYQHHSPCLMTDFYQLTMAYGFWKAKMHQMEACYLLHFRKLPFNGGITIAAGLESAIEALKNFKFKEDDLDYLKTLDDPVGERLFDDAFLDFLRNLKFTCDIFAVEEGEIVFPYEPLMRVQGPLIECQLIESVLLNIINFQTLIATKAARLYIAANKAPIFEFGFRRAQGIDGALSASRAAYIGGCSGTSNVLAGKLYNIPVKGTHAHSWVMAFDEEIESFETFADVMPNNCIFLVDTYHTIEGIKKAIEVGKKLREKNKPFLGIRLDSGDLAYLSMKAREMLDAEGFKNTQVLASNELDEVIIRDLIQQGAQICIWGVGTNLVTSGGQSSLDGVYKMSAVREPGKDWKYRIKLSEQMRKTTNPGILQVRRFTGDSKRNIGDAIYDVNTMPKGEEWTIVDPLDISKRKSFSCKGQYRDLLIPIFKKGKVVYQPPSLETIKKKVSKELSHFHTGLKRFLFPHQYPVGLEEGIYQYKLKLIDQIRNKS